jgi:ribonuclease R
VRVQVARVDLDDKKIDLELIGSHSNRKDKGGNKDKPNKKHARKRGKARKTGTRKQH